jgi:hypothetical protein
MYIRERLSSELLVHAEDEMYCVGDCHHTVHECAGEKLLSVRAMSDSGDLPRPLPLSVAVDNFAVIDIPVF